MGQGPHGQSKHQQVKTNRENLEELTEVVKQMLDAWKSHVVDATLLSHKSIDERFATGDENSEANFAMLLELRERVLFNEMPFYRRWYSRLYWWWKRRKESLVKPPSENGVSDDATEPGGIAPADTPAPAAEAGGDEPPIPEAFAATVRGEHNDETN